MTNSKAIQGITYGGIIAASSLGVYLLYKTKNAVTDPKVQDAAKSAFTYPTAAKDILVEGKRYNTEREIYTGEGGTRKRKYFEGNKKKRGTKKGKR